MSGLETKTVQGIKVSIDPASLSDWDVLLGLMELSTPTDIEELSEEEQMRDSAQKMKAIINITNTVFGKEQFETIKQALREENGGYLPVEVLAKFISEVFNVYQVKKS